MKTEPQIFVTVGTQLPFDRLIRAMDQWAGEQSDARVVAQTGASTYRPRHLEWSSFMHGERFAQELHVADVIVAHAGMGTILTAIDLAKPLVIVPRQATLGEHRNDHQLATAERFDGFAGLCVVHDVDDIPRVLGEIRNTTSDAGVTNTVSGQLLETIHHFLGGHGEASCQPSH